jgi:pimeloyl-ACP methyl ester carboxylesterase
MKRLLKMIAALVAVLAVVYFLGPKPTTPNYNNNLIQVPSEAAALEAYVASNEAKHKIKPDNEARIVWANDSIKAKTPYVIVYLHGFSASQEEGNPVHKNIAKQFGCNMYLARLSEHGIDTIDPLVNMTATSLWESAKEAYAIGKQLGDKVILMGTSTGGTVALELSSNFEDVAGLVLYSPNIAINNPLAFLSNNPWGLQIARMVTGGKENIIKNKPPEFKKYWNDHYRLEAIVELQELLETTMIPSHFNKIKCPVLTLYYFKDEKNQDPVVKVSAMKEMFEALATPANLKRMVPIPEAGNHVMASPIQSNDIVSVEKETALFLEQIMQLKKVMYVK